MYGLTDIMHRVVEMTHSVAEMTRGMMWLIHSLGQLNWKLIHFGLYTLHFLQEMKYSINWKD